MAPALVLQGPALLPGSLRGRFLGRAQTHDASIQTISFFIRKGYAVVAAAAGNQRDQERQKEAPSAWLLIALPIVKPNHHGQLSVLNRPRHCSVSNNRGPWWLFFLPSSFQTTGARAERHRPDDHRPAPLLIHGEEKEEEEEKTPSRERERERTSMSGHWCVTRRRCMEVGHLTIRNRYTRP